MILVLLDWTWKNFGKGNEQGFPRIALRLFVGAYDFIALGGGCCVGRNGVHWSGF